MKLLYSLLLILPAVSHSAIVDVFFAGGQSNATSQWASGIESVLAAHYRNPVLVHQRHSGNALYKWYNNGPAANYETDFFNSDGTGTLQTTLAEILANGDTYRFNGLFWFQGEGDTGSMVDIDTWGSRFNGMLTQLQADMGVDPFRFAIAVIDADRSMTDFYQDTNIDALRSIQFSLGSNPLGLGFDSASYPRVDKWHLDFNTATTFGQDMANAYMSAVPIPAAAWLFFGALGLVGFVGYRAEL